MTRRSDFRIRDYDPGDLDGVIRVFVDAIRLVARKDYNPDQIAAWSAVDRDEWARWRLTRPTFVAEVDGEIIGFSDLENDGHLDMMFVAPHQQRRGVSKALLARVERQARMLGLTFVYAEASKTARPFFESQGFAVTGPVTIEEGGQVFDLFAVEKAISPDRS